MEQFCREEVPFWLAFCAQEVEVHCGSERSLGVEKTHVVLH